MLPIVLVAAQTAAATPAVHHGRERQLSVAPPRIEARATIDGALDEPAWGSAALLTGFSQYRPVDGRPAVDSTDVLVWYAPDAIYFGVRAYEPHGAVRATLADRDRIDSDDYVQILLDTFDDRRRAFVFGVNPLGVQADGIRTEGGFGAAGGPGAGGRFENVDLNPDFVYESKGRLTSFGYEIEIRIPFKSIAYQSADPQRWAVNIIRKIQHSAYEDTWVPAERANASFLAQSGTLDGLRDLHRGLVLDVNPFATGRVPGEPDSTGAWAYDLTPEVGINASWGISNALSFDATINPDFSQVEADVGQITVNERFPVFFPEKRPFFLEGIEQFNTPNSLIYTRRIRRPIGGGKLTGKVSGTSIALLTAVDEQAASAGGTDNPIVNALRVRRDLGGQSTAGLAYTDRIDGRDFNRVVSADARLVFAKLYFLEVQAATSVTRAGGTTRTAPLWEVTADRTGRSWGFNYRVTGIHADFQAETGFVPRSGIVEPSIANRLTVYGAPGALLENWTGFFRLTGIWDYDGFFRGENPLETNVGHTSFLTVRGGWSATISPEWQTVAFDPTFYADYATVTASDTVPFAVPDRLNGLYGMRVSASTPQFSSVSASTGASLGKAAAFFEPAAANTYSINGTVDWRPTDQLRVQGRYVYAVLNRVRDGTRLSTAHIPRVKVEYQLARPIFVRFVGQYNAQKRDALRDPATERPILIHDGTGAFATATRQVDNDLRIDWLFSYRPVPGTVLFAGYGSSLTETETFSFSDLRRVNDGFFFKLSYLFRV
ncbi:MAG TPA: DUF5916 domain-containing protein [Gemmatimonadales bacterium]